LTDCRSGDYSKDVKARSLPWACSSILVGLVCGEAFCVERGSYVNFETAPVHPIALSSDGYTLAVCNLPDNRLELFNVSSGVPVHIGDVPVGLDPVSVRFRGTNEIWVVNHISCSVNIVDLAQRRIVATLHALAGPADVAFAGTPLRAFVTCAKANTVQIFDPVARVTVANVVIDGERPKAMALSADGSKLYVAIFESGNASTILGRRLSGIEGGPGFGPVDYEFGPYGGQNPPPNDGAGFNPSINPSIPTNEPPPAISHIVKKDAAGMWKDDNTRDWTDFITGAGAFFSGRLPGWDMPDRDIAIIDTTTLDVSYATGLMNICMNLAVNPVSGMVAVVGTDGENERRFEPNLKGIFHKVKLALVDPVTLQKTVKDLNPHLDYQTRSLPRAERDKSIGDPRGIVWNVAGTRAYVTGMGSRNLVILDGNGDRVRTMPVELGEGPTGLALDEPRQRLYILNRFSASVAVVRLSSEHVVINVPLFDPTPVAVKTGRKHLYDTRKNSGLGHASCASCHVDARMDRLAWDLGDPRGNVFPPSNIVVMADENIVRSFHPMKGPMVTQTLQDIIGHEPFHWRGDRTGIEEFNQTFTNLLGNDVDLAPAEMQEFKNFLATIHFPPSLFRNFDNSLSTNLPLDGQFSILGTPLPNGNAVQGITTFQNFGDENCFRCHSAPSGLSDDSFGILGPNGERHLKLVAVRRSEFHLFKSPQMRNLADKIGMNLNGPTSRAGFGFIHDGRVDTLARFVQDGFGLNEIEGPETLQMIADTIALMLSFSGADVSDPVNTNDVPSQTVPAAVGKQLTLATPEPPPLLSDMLALADSPSSGIDLIARGIESELRRGWFYDPSLGAFQSDRHSETLSVDQLLALAGPDHELTLMVVPRNSGHRIGIDRDEDGYFDRTEIDFGSNPADRNSTPARILSITRTETEVLLRWQATPGATYRLQFKDNLSHADWQSVTNDIIADGVIAQKADIAGGAQQRYYRVQLVSR
jgi:DNA-binding beta-propeller fold protein YncE